MLTYSSDYMYAGKVGSNGIADHTRDEISTHQQAAMDKVVQSLSSNEYGFVEMLKTQHYVQQVISLYSQIQWANTLVVVGIGGSDLGGRAIQESLGAAPRKQVIFHGDSTDPNDIDKLLSEIDIHHTVFNIVSKSGNTIEVMSQYIYLRQLVEGYTEDWAKHFVFTTDPQQGTLRQQAEKHGVLTLEIPRNVGGRYSVLSPVGLLPALMMGVDIYSLVAGALEVAHSFPSDPKSSNSFQIAKQEFELYQHGIKSVVFMPYSSKLNEFARWFRQLWAESLGKEHRGVLPIQARGPADQHSQLQYYTQGAVVSSFLFLKIEDHGSDHRFTQVDVPGLEYLEGHSFGDLINIEQQATGLALMKIGRPNATLTVSKVTPRSLGAMFMTFELAVILLAEMFKVDPFDQPGVEESKQMISALLGKEGFEQKRKEIEGLLQS